MSKTCKINMSDGTLSIDCSSNVLGLQLNNIKGNYKFLNEDNNNSLLKISSDRKRILIVDINNLQPLNKIKFEYEGKLSSNDMIAAGENREKLNVVRSSESRGGPPNLEIDEFRPTLVEPHTTFDKNPK